MKLTNKEKDAIQALRKFLPADISAIDTGLRSCVKSLNKKSIIKINDGYIDWENDVSFFDDQMFTLARF